MSVKNILGNRFSLEDRFIPDYSLLAETVSTVKKSGLKLGLVQGTWDMFHEGHALYIVRAKEDHNVDILIAVVDSDELTRKRKGKARPFDKFKERMLVVAAQRAVDIVTAKYADDSPHKIIELVRPDVLIVSQRVEDILTEDLAKFKEVCGIVYSLASQSSASTTAKLRRVRKEGAVVLANRLQTVVNDFMTEYIDGMTEGDIEQVLPHGTCDPECEEISAALTFIKEWNTK